MSASTHSELPVERDASDGASEGSCAPAGCPAVSRVGEVIGDLEIESRIAEGAMGCVYRARRRANGERVAVKILHPDAAAEPVAVERFKREYETAFGFDHPHIVRVRGFGETPDGSYYMTMELLDGEPLSSILSREGKLAPERALRIVCQMASAIEHAHSYGVIHRDLKPANIFLERGPGGTERVKLLDFGSVKLQLETGPKLTAFGTTVGSPSYMSPEQAEGLTELDPRADVFSLAAVAYEMLTGAVAFDGETAAEVLSKILRGTFTPASVREPSLPLGINLVLAAGLRRDKASRTGSAREFAEGLLRVFGLEPDVDGFASASLEAIRGALDSRRSRDITVRVEQESADDEAGGSSAVVWISACAATLVVSAIVAYLVL